MDMEKGVALVVVSVWAREVVSVWAREVASALAMAMAMELVVSGEEQQVVARQVDSSFWSESNGSRRRQLCRAAGAVDT